MYYSFMGAQFTNEHIFGTPGIYTEEPKTKNKRGCRKVFSMAKLSYPV